MLGGTVSPGALQRTLTYDAASRISTYAHTDTSGASAPSWNQSFGYDNLDRLTNVGASTSQSYGYDLSGNRTTFTVGASTYTNAIAPTSNRLSSTTGPSPAKSNSYDAAGNLLSDNSATFTYSDRGRLASATRAGSTVTYLYNGFGERTIKSGPTALVQSGTQRYVYDQGGHLLGEYETNTQSIQETVWLGDLPVAVMKPQANTVIVDNADAANVVQVGTWAGSTTTPGYWATGYHTHVASSGTDSFTFKLNIPTTGSYQIYARWTADTNRSSAAKYTITHTAGNTISTQNQRINGNQWRSLGTYTFNAGTNTIKLSTDTSGYVIADAVSCSRSLIDRTWEFTPVEKGDAIW